MKLWVRGSILSVLALATIQAFASNQTTSSIALQATVPTTDNLTCSGPANFGTSVAYGTPATAAVNCSVTTNDTNGVTMTVYVSGANALTGSGTNAIPYTALGVYASGASAGQTNIQTAYTALSATGWTGATSGEYGLDLATFADSDSSYSPTLNLQLSVPANTKADTYTGTLNVVITPIS
jgi:hypothetical protein